MSLLMYAPLSDSALPMPVDFDFDFEDLDFRTLTEAPPAEALEPSLSAAVQLPASLANISGDIWKDLSSASSPSSPEPRSVIDFIDESEVIVKQEFEEDSLFQWSAALLDAKQLRNDCMWSAETPYTPPSQSESEDDDDHPRFKHSFDMVLGLVWDLFDDVDSSSFVASGSSLDAVSVFCDTVNCDLDLDDEAYVASLAEAAEQMCRPSVTSHAPSESGRAKSNSRKKEAASRREKIKSSRHAFMSDHSYHLRKGAVKTEHLGVQTPSDSGAQPASVGSSPRRGDLVPHVNALTRSASHPKEATQDVHPASI